MQYCYADIFSPLIVCYLVGLIAELFNSMKARKWYLKVTARGADIIVLAGRCEIDYTRLVLSVVPSSQ